MLQVSRDGNLKIPKVIKLKTFKDENIESRLAIKQAYSAINNHKFNEEDERKKLEENNFKNILKIPFNSNDLIVITKAKKLGAYVIMVTEKSPKKYRGVFVNRMQNYCLDTLECLIKANFIRMDSEQNKKHREELQRQAIIKLKLLGYISMLSESVGCILKKQYKLISQQLTETINLIVAWKKSDDTRYKNK